MTTIAIAIMSFVVAVALVLLALAVVLRIASRNSVDRDYDAEEIDAHIAAINAHIAAIKEANEQMQLDERPHMRAGTAWGQQ